MSTTLLHLLQTSDPLLVHYTGLTTAETGGTVRPVQYDDDAPATPPANVVSMTAAVALERLTSVQETAMPYDYDAHYLAMRGDHDPGPTIDQQRRAERWPLWLSALVLIGASAGLWALIIAGVLAARELFS